MKRHILISSLVLTVCTFSTIAQQKKSLHSELLHTAQPDYPVPYGASHRTEIKKVLDRVYNYLNEVTPTRIINKQTKELVTDFSKPDSNVVVERGDFSLTSYEWGVTYSGMLSVASATGDTRYNDYVKTRLDFLAQYAPYFKKQKETFPELKRRYSLVQVVEPHALDDCGAMCAAMIRTQNAGLSDKLRPLIDNYINYISTKEFRLPDGTLARNRPLPNTLWLDDLFMSVPALMQMGKLTGQQKYYDDATKQVLQFAKRMFNKEKGVFMHGWVQSMDVHPEFYWGRANGWAILTMTELLDILPEKHPNRAAILELYKAHVNGLASYQDGTGFWHQLLNRTDSYLETSATAIYTYSIAKGINKGWIDANAYGPMVMLGWNAVATKVTEKGQVEGVCVGTGMGFDPAFYYYRPVNVYAAHGYGPVLLAGSEIIRLIEGGKYSINDSAVQYEKK